MTDQRCFPSLTIRCSPLLGRNNAEEDGWRFHVQQSTEVLENFLLEEHVKDKQPYALKYKLVRGLNCYQIVNFKNSAVYMDHFLS